MQIPLFPLQTVLYPDGPLPLRIFEPRYLDMISRCLKDGSSFGVVQIREGSETGLATTFAVGTLACITDWYQGSDGILGVTAVGHERFRLLSHEQQADGLNIGQVELLDEGAPVLLPDEYRPLTDILDGVLEELGRLYENLPRRIDDAAWVGYRFAEILPIEPDDKQRCLEIENPLERLHLIREALDDVRA